MGSTRSSVETEAVSVKAPPSRPSVGATISWRTLALALPVVVYFCWGGPGIGNYNHLPGGSIVLVLLMVAAFNPLAGALRLRRFTPAELAVLFRAVTVGILVIILPIYFVPQVVGPFYLATPESGWEQTVLPLYPEHLFVRDPLAVRWFYEGTPGPIPWAAWLQPSVWWMALMLLFCAASFFMASVLRRRWTDEEHITYPLVQVPAEILTSPDRGRAVNAFLRDPVLWLGALLPVAVEGLRGLHVHFPSVPNPAVDLDLGPLLHSRPWSEMQPFVAIFQSSVVGLAYLLPTEISASF